MPWPSSILARFTFSGCQWRWMCSLHWSSFWAKRWIHVPQCHRGFREPICYSFQWLRKRKSTSKQQFLWTSFTHLGTHHAHTLLYLSSTWTMVGTVSTNHSTAMDKTQTMSRWFSKPSPDTCTMFTCTWSAWLKCAIIMMDANQLLNSLHPLPTWCKLQHYRAVNFKGENVLRIHTGTVQRSLHDRVSTIITTTRKLIP
jgi:hypothetical protein